MCKKTVIVLAFLAIMSLTYKTAYCMSVNLTVDQINKAIKYGHTNKRTSPKDFAVIGMCVCLPIAETATAIAAVGLNRAKFHEQNARTITSLIKGGAATRWPPAMHPVTTKGVQEFQKDSFCHCTTY